MALSPNRPAAPPPAICAANPMELAVHGDFLEWLAQAGGTLAVSTYNSGKVALLAADGGGLAASFWKFPRPMGLAACGPRLAVATVEHICHFHATESHEAATGATESPGGADDRPQEHPSRRLELAASYHTGRLDAHDLAFDRRGLLLANTRFNSVSRTSDRVNFVQHWRPWFIDGTIRRDCCHLNGLGVKDGRLAMATAFCDRGEAKAWREGNRFTSGVLIDVRANQIAVRGLNMPHSPRWHDGRWWLCNSGEGTLCTYREGRDLVEPIAALPGFTRGLALAAGRAAVGLSRIRRRHILDAPPVRQRSPALQSGVALVCPRSGRVTGGVEFLRGGREVYEVAFLENLPRLAFSVAADLPA